MRLPPSPQLAAFTTHLVAVKNASPRTVHIYQNATARFLEKHPTPEKVTREQAESYTQHLGATHAASTQALHLSALRQFYVFLLQQGWLAKNPTANEQNPFARVKSPRLPQKLPKALSLKQTQRLLSCLQQTDAKNLRLRLMLQLLYGAGLRISELTALTLASVAHVAQEGVLEVTGKGQKIRLIPMGETLQNTLRLYIETARPQFLGKKSTDALFPSYGGKPISRQRVFQLLQKLGEACGIERLGPHTLRHTFATHLVENNADLFSVQQLLGHASLNTTQIYTKVTTDKAREVLEANHPLGSKQ